jgi:hypothetical protein
MLQWIANLFHTKPTEPPWVHRIERGDLDARVCEYTKRCGHEGYAVELRGVRSDTGDRVGLAFLGAESLQRAVMLLQEALEFVNDRASQPRQLQTVRLWGAMYYADERLGELRREDDPSDRVPLTRAE